MGDALPFVLLGDGRTAVQVSAGPATTCAVLDDLSTKCWGHNAHGELGLGDTVDRGSTPESMGNLLPTIDLGADPYGTNHFPVEMTAGLDHTCVRLEDGSVRCWGKNTNGELGIGSSGNNIGDAPGEMGAQLDGLAVDLGTGRYALDIETGETHTCALLDDASLRCWGGNAVGQLGAVLRASRWATTFRGSSRRPW